MTKRLGLRQLRAFHAVIVTGSVTAAAERLNLTQPAISKQLSDLEHAIRLRLFDRRSGRAATPTQQGLDFFRAIEATIVGLEEIETIASDIEHRNTTRIRIAATPPLINSAPLMAATSRFIADHPDVRIALEPRHRIEIEDWVVARHIDLALALLPSNHPGLTETPLVETRAVVVMPADHRLAAQETVSPEDIQDDRLILPSRQPLRTRIDAALNKAGLHVSAQLESSSAITCCRMAASGLGVALCDPFSPTSFVGSGLITRPWRPEVHLTYGILQSKQHALDNRTKRIMSYLKVEFERFATA
ncbi:LysR family transcriptional regulator [Phaeobacter sp. J2-8]|uniref:LysR family transcriptional regulator n=1 Tax=Phaeobacter sp. J2-8 TaxID=2931394 RepID=UPI001FD01C10|nr:LysR family transcriptional regulator [Phaeobacter sp. J2-8]MCJ7873439.1 LysR family transcriptional regulator [Phaeobacter sp. J2-8]